VPAVAVFLLLLLASGLPQVEDPLPDRIGLSAPFIGAGAGSVVAGVIFAAAPQCRRERAIRLGGVLGFGLGAGLYLLSLTAQLI
jgi:hypothetical protein